ncbi:phosphopantothenate/pantothenate synthetase [Candidatus Bathyarchaeota archaeon]|nr:phosphopantothenate/pantothenate synthetase [Candidatus Bathyarchaeota archaeon]
MKTPTKIPGNHPRAESLRIRENLVEAFEDGAVARAGLIAHGRGEAFDYLLGEQTIQPARKAIRAAAALLLIAKRPVVSVNGNSAALTAEEIVSLSELVKAEIEVNIFYRTAEREEIIESLLVRAGAKKVLGVGEGNSACIPELGSERRRVSTNGILVADVVLVPLEDGDRTEALLKMGKKVIAIDLNPISRTSQKASITVVDNLVRAMPELIKEVKKLRQTKKAKLNAIIKQFDNRSNLQRCLSNILERLERLADERGLTG